MSTMSTRSAAACGEDCTACERFPNECPGCTLTAHPACAFLLCILERDLEHCGVCLDFPCANLRALVPRHPPGDLPDGHIRSLRRRAWIGTRAWLWEQGRDPGPGAERRPLNPRD